MKNIINILLLLLISNFLVAQTGHKLRLQADELYSNGEHEEAELNYKKALEKEEEYKANYNLGNTLYNQQRFEEASEAYKKSLGETNNNLIKSKLYHNLGNTYFQTQKFEESMESLKESLRLNPTDDDTRKNLSLVKQIIKQLEQQQKQQEQKNDDQNKDQEKDKENQDKQQEQDNQQDENQEEKDKKEQNEDQEKNEDEENKQMLENGDSTKLDSVTISKEEMQKLLNAIENDDKEIQKKVRKVNSKSKKKDKDW